MGKDNLDVLGIGNAIVDVLAKVDDVFLDTNGIHKGTMTLVDAARSEELYAKMKAPKESSGGSAANTIAALASLGGRAGFIGKVAHDPLGSAFTHDIRDIGVVFDTQPLIGGVSTARCMILITPDAQRTMNTYLGACVWLSPDDVNEEMVKNAQVTYLEGYLFDRDQAKEAFYKAARVAHKAGRKVALTLSDPFCVDRHRKDFLDLIEGHVDILFANEAEITSLYEAGSFDEAVAQVKGHCEVAALTRSAEGSVIIRGDEATTIRADRVSQVVDTTGAGDLYAAGFLYGYTHRRSMADCGRLASICAAEIIAQIGARPQRSLADLVREKKAV